MPSDGYTALHRACDGGGEGHMETIRVLVTEGGVAWDQVSPDNTLLSLVETDHKHSPLIGAAVAGREHVPGHCWRPHRGGADGRDGGGGAGLGEETGEGGQDRGEGGTVTGRHV